jgi:hypothetical protein
MVNEWTRRKETRINIDMIRRNEMLVVWKWSCNLHSLKWNWKFSFMKQRFRVKGCEGEKDKDWRIVWLVKPLLFSRLLSLLFITIIPNTWTLAKSQDSCNILKMYSFYWNSFLHFPLSTLNNVFFHVEMDCHYSSEMHNFNQNSCQE